MAKPASSSADDSSRNLLLEQILADFLRAKETGQGVDPQLIVAAHPDLADELWSFFQNHAAVNQLAAPLRDVIGAQDTPTLDHGASGVAGIGTRLKYFGDYELLDEIARGGMGVVFKAKQLSLKRVVAVKMILAGQLASGASMQRFRSEAEAAAKLDHPNIVPIFEIGEHAGQHYFSMAFVEGQSLAEIVRPHPLAADRAVRYVRTIALAIHYAHEQGVLHRDLKPSNVLIDRADQPRVTDFGLAKSTGSEAGMTATGDVLGTPSYMPPEQAAGKSEEIGPRSDVYSLGAMLYELVTGRPPFRAATPLDTVMQVLAAEPAAPRLLNPAISKDLETIILKCLRKEPGSRYSSAQALADDLLALQEGRPIQARRPGLVEHAGRWLKKQSRSAVIAAIAGCVALVLAALAIAGWNEYKRSQLGSLLLKTAGPPLRAEILNEFNEPVAPSFTVPTEQPVEVPAGTYWLRLSAQHQLSETLQLEVAAAATQQATVALTPRMFRVKPEALPPRPPYFDLGPEEDDPRVQQGFLLAPEIEARLRPDADSPVSKFAALLKKLGFRPVAQPRFVQMPGEKPVEAVILMRREQNRSLTMLAVEASSAKTIWEQPLKAYWPKNGSHFSPASEQLPIWPLVDDLNGDGAAELVMPELDPVEFECTLGIAVHEVKTGQRKWGVALHPHVQERFGPTSVLRMTFDDVDKQGQMPALQFIAGPDIDGDGWREIYAASLQQRHEHRHNRHTILRAAALSGKTGGTLWQWQSHSTEFTTGVDVNPPRWWRTGSDGLPELLLSFKATDNYPRLNSSYVLSTRDGRLKEILPSVTQPQVADLNGDQAPDLYDLSGVHGYIPGAQSKAETEALSGQPQRAWSRIGGCEPVADLDGDGTLDLKLLSGTSPSGPSGYVSGIISGRTGDFLWRIQAPLTKVQSQQLRQLDLDFDGDGTPDLLHFERLGRNGQQLSAVSGKTGQPIWQRRLAIAGSDGHVTELNTVEGHDLTGDGQPELLCTFDWQRTAGNTSDMLHREWLLAFDTATGKSLWQTPLNDETLASDYSTSRGPAPRMAVGDFNQDGKPDLALWSNGYRSHHQLTGDKPHPSNGLVTLDGQTGKRIWYWPLPEHSQLPTEHDYGDNPVISRPALADLNGDGVLDVVGMHHYYPPGQKVPAAPNDVCFLEVIALNGRDGQPLWTFRKDDPQSYIAPGHHQPSPRIQRVNGKPSVIVFLPLPAIPGRGGWTRQILYRLDEQGKVLEPADIENPEARAKYLESDSPWHFWVGDLEHDGDDEVLAYYGRDLIAYERGLTKERWRLRLIHDPKVKVPAHRDMPALVATLYRTTADGNLAEAIPEPGPYDPPFRWRIDVARDPDERSQLTVRCGLGLVNFDATTGHPRWHVPVGKRWQHSLQAPGAAGLPLALLQSDEQVAATQLATPFPDSGLRPELALTSGGPPFAPRLTRSLPWAGEYLRWDSWVSMYFFWTGGSAYLAAASLALFVLAIWLGCLAWQYESRMLGYAAVVLAIGGPCLNAIKFDPGVIGLTVQYGLPFVLPVLVFMVCVVIEGWKQRWLRVAALNGIALSISVAVGLVWLAIDAPTLAANERYVASQDWSIVLVGIYVVGVALLLRLALAAVISLFTRKAKHC